MARRFAATNGSRILRGTWPLAVVLLLLAVIAGCTGASRTANPMTTPNAHSGNLAGRHPPHAYYGKEPGADRRRNRFAPGDQADAGPRDSLPYSSEGSPFGEGTKWLASGQRPGPQDIGRGETIPLLSTCTAP